MVTKICTGCNEEKTLDQFSKNKNHSHGYQYVCKACAKAKMRAYRAENPEQPATYRADNRDQIRSRGRTYHQSPKGKFNTYKGSAKHRNLAFDLTMDEFMSFWQADCSYCGDPISTIGIDRIDSALGYAVGNCVPCCTRCNVIKMDYDIDETDAHMIKMLRYRGVI